jgi:hypothetical protein
VGGPESRSELGEHTTERAFYPIDPGPSKALARGSLACMRDTTTAAKTKRDWEELGRELAAAKREREAALDKLAKKGRRTRDVESIALDLLSGLIISHALNDGSVFRLDKPEKTTELLGRAVRDAWQAARLFVQHAEAQETGGGSSRG